MLQARRLVVSCSFLKQVEQILGTVLVSVSLGMTYLAYVAHLHALTRYETLSALMWNFPQRRQVVFATRVLDMLDRHNQPLHVVIPSLARGGAWSFTKTASKSLLFSRACMLKSVVSNTGTWLQVFCQLKE